MRHPLGGVTLLMALWQFSCGGNVASTGPSRDSACMRCKVGCTHIETADCPHHMKVDCDSACMEVSAWEIACRPELDGHHPDHDASSTDQLKQLNFLQDPCPAAVR